MPILQSGGEQPADPCYIILVSPLTTELSVEVAHYISQGWHPVGGVATLEMGIGKENKSQYIMQAMRRLGKADRFLRRLGL